MSIGNVYFQSKNKAKTNLYYDKAETLIKTMKDTEQLANMYDTRGVVYDQMGSYDTSMQYFEKALALEKAAGMEDYSYNTLSNIGLNYKHQHRTAEAIKAFDTVAAYFIKTNAPKTRLRLSIII